MLDLLIKNGTVVSNGTTVRADVGVAGDKIAGVWLGEHGAEAKATIDASGKIVMPGAIDCHFHTQTGSAYHSTRADNLETASITAALGGITTIIPFVWGDPGQQPREYLESFLELGSSLCVTDFTGHCGLRPEMDAIKLLQQSIDLGITSFKMQLSYRRTGQSRMSDDDHRMAAMERIGRAGGLAMFHCENGYVIDYLEEKYIAEGKTTREYLLKSRPNLAESETIYRSVVLGELTECPVYVVHLSTKEGLEEILRAQAQGKRVYTETCPQYLTLTNDEVLKKGGLAKVGPPLREAADNEAMWRGLAMGVCESVGSDHSAWRPEAKAATGDDRVNIFPIGFGMPCVETMVPVVYSEGVAKGRISLERFVEAFTEKPAKRFGLFPRKGALLPGSDADILMIDPEARWTVRGAELYNPAGYSLWDGRELRGKPERSWLRGQPLLVDGQVKPTKGSGTFLPRKPAV